MSWSQSQQGEDTHDQMTVLVGSAIQLLRGECGVFVISSEAFDPQSSTEYTFYHLNESVLPLLLSYVQEGMQPNALHPLVKETLTLELAQQFGLTVNMVQERGVECCSLALYDEVGPLGMIHFLRWATLRSCFERTDDDKLYNALQLFVTQLATSLRFALRSKALLKEQGRLAAIFQHSTEGILTVDNALRIIDFNPAMQHLTGWRESEVLGQFYFKVLRPKDRQGNDLGLQNSIILQAFAGEEVVNREMLMCARDGSRFAVSVTASCVRSAHGEPMNGILNIHDLTRERQQEEQRSTFISVISHELQTPISIIKGYASTLARTDANFDTGTIHSRLLAIEDEQIV